MIPESRQVPSSRSVVSAIPEEWLGYDPGIAAMLLQVNESEMYQTTYDLQNFSTRAAHSPGNKQAATYVYNRLNSIDGLKTEYQGGDHRNIISTLQGKNTSSDMIFIVGAHYDSISSNPDKAPGATDNGCGVAIVMELARIMSQHEFNNTVQFAFWNAEESGSSGCRDYVTYAARNSLNIPLYFNFDSSCYDPDNQYVLDIMYDDTSAPVAELLTQYNSLYGINFTLTNNIHTCSGDHLVFRDYGYPAIMTHSKSHGPQAHTENDTIEMMSPHYAKKNAQLGLSVLARLLEIRPE